MRSDRPHRRFALLGLMTFAILASGSPGHAAIIDGADVSAEEFPEVYAITYSDPEIAGKKRLCSAVLVESEVLLTAAHCLPADPTTPIDVIAGPDARTPAAVFTSHRSARHGVYVSTDDEIERTGYDVGIVVLDSPIPDATGATGAGLATLGSLADFADRAAARENGVVVVGFGGKKTTGVDRTTGRKRTADTRVLEMTDVAFTTSGPHGGISHGDSGGPAFVRVDGKLRLIGIASGSPKDEGGILPARPEVSLYAGLRPELASWIELASGRALPTPPARSDGIPEFIGFGTNG